MIIGSRLTARLMTCDWSLIPAGRSCPWTLGAARQPVWRGLAVHRRAAAAALRRPNDGALCCPGPRCRVRLLFNPPRVLIHLLVHHAHRSDAFESCTQDPQMRILCRSICFPWRSARAVVMSAHCTSLPTASAQERHSILHTGQSLDFSPVLVTSISLRGYSNADFVQR